MDVTLDVVQVTGGWLNFEARAKSEILSQTSSVKGLIELGRRGKRPEPVHDLRSVPSNACCGPSRCTVSLAEWYENIKVETT